MKNKKIVRLSFSTMLILIGLGVLLFTFFPVIKEEVKFKSYQVSQKISRQEGIENVLEPPNKDFSIVIPKIMAVAPVISDVNAFNEKEFLGALKKGVAHAYGTSYPGMGGNIFIFAHSTDAFYNVGRYNAVFYLIGKLENGDLIEVYFNNHKYIYRVFDKKVVPSDAIQYLNSKSTEEILTLMTCYPPGTTYKRLIIQASKVQE